MAGRRRPSIGLVWAAAGIVACGEPSEPLRPDSLRVASVQIAPATVEEGDTVRLHAVVRDSSAIVLAVPVRWESADPAILTIDSSGLATARDVPTDTSVTVIARAGIGLAQATVTVVFRPVFGVWPDTNVLWAGMSRALAARMDSTTPNLLNPDIDTVAGSTWQSGNPAIVTVDGNGVITGHAVGQTWVRARLGRDSADVAVRVIASPPTLRFTTASGGPAMIFNVPNFGPSHLPRGCGLVEDGRLYCWGQGISVDGWSDACERNVRTGQSRSRRHRTQCLEVPALMHPSLTFTSMVAPSSLGCGVTTNRRIYCWGMNTDGELGIGTTDSTFHGVTPIASTDEFRSVHVREVDDFPMGIAACGVRTDNAVLCWGWGFTPTPTLLPGVQLAKMADALRCGITPDGGAHCIDGAPFPASGLVDIATTLYGYEFCGLAGDGVVRCSRDATVSSTPLPFSRLVTYHRWGRGGAADICGLSGSGELLCGSNTVSGFSSTPLWSGFRFRTLFGNCGVGVDNKAYCWDLTSMWAVPGQ
jgi:hypothetical protein